MTNNDIASDNDYGADGYLINYILPLHSAAQDPGTGDELTYVILGEGTSVPEVAPIFEGVQPTHLANQPGMYNSHNFPPFSLTDYILQSDIT